VASTFTESGGDAVTPNLLLKLRKTLGDEATNDLVTWVDQATARELGHIRELAELHYGRFDARLEQRLAELRAELDARVGSVRAELEARIDRVDLRIETVRAELIKWMFLFWVGTVVPLAGLMVALLKF
jgi:ABC-type phosphate transport system auxiliary subunit